MKPMILMAALLWAVSVVASPFSDYSFADKAEEERFKALTSELRCLVCQNQSIADSNAELALDLRDETYEMFKAGKTDEEIIEFMVQRYGDFVLYRPPLRQDTLVLWFGPFVILIAAALLLIRYVRRKSRGQTEETVEFTEADRERMRNALNRDDEDRS